VIGLRKDEKRQAANDYVTGDYLCQIFQEDMQSLYRLAFQATASYEHAEQCFFAGIKAPLNEYMVLKMVAPLERPDCDQKCDSSDLGHAR
jgi:hypothetical protein